MTRKPFQALAERATQSILDRVAEGISSMSIGNKLVFALLSLCTSATVGATTTVLVGVLETQPDANAAEGALATSHVRLAFQRKDGAWTPICEGKSSGRRNDGCAIPDPEQRRAWDVVFNGRPRGRLETAGWRNSDFYSFTGALTITTSPVPGVEDSAASFAAWWGQPVRRPLVAVNGLATGSQSAEVWFHEPIQSADSTSAWPLFKNRISSIPNCRFSDEGKPLGSARPAKLTDMVVFDHVRLRRGGVLLGVHAKSPDDCAEGGGFASDFWVYKPLNGPAFVLNGFDTSGWSYGLKLVDVGAFAGDGSLQAVFAFSGYDEDGYVLYYDGFRKRAQFTWGYH